MRAVMSRVVVVVILVLIGVAVVLAQQAPPPVIAPPASAGQAPAPAPAPSSAPAVSPQQQQTYVLLRFQAQVQNRDIAALQKELDSTNAELGRLLSSLAIEGFDLDVTPQGQLYYKPKTAAAAPPAEKK